MGCPRLVRTIGSSSMLAENDDREKREGSERDDVADGLVTGLGVADVYGGGAGRDRECDETVVALDVVRMVEKHTAGVGTGNVP